MNENLTLAPKMDLGILSILFLACAIAPFFVDAYQLQFVRELICLSIFATSVNLLWAQGGLLGFGQATFFGLGAYGMAITSDAFHSAMGPWLGLVSGMAAAASVSLLIGYFLLFGGVRGAYFTIVTLALGIIFEQIVLAFPEITGGNTGIISAMELTLPGGNLLQGTPLYLTSLGILMLLCGLLHKLNVSRHGLVLRAILDNEQRASALGNNTTLYLLFVFVGSATCAALAGALYASGSGFVAPDTIGLSFSTQAIIWVAIGARGTLSGPVIGAFLIIWLENSLSALSMNLWPLMLGALFVTAVFFLPRGVIGLLVSCLNRVGKTSILTAAKS